jgi:hypothetical protein
MVQARLYRAVHGFGEAGGHTPSDLLLVLVLFLHAG